MTCKAHLIVPGARVIVSNEAGYQFGPLFLHPHNNGVDCRPISFYEEPPNGTILEILDIPKRYQGGVEVVKVLLGKKEFYVQFTHIRRQTTPCAK